MLSPVKGISNLHKKTKQEPVISTSERAQNKNKVGGWINMDKISKERFKISKFESQELDNSDKCFIIIYDSTQTKMIPI